MLPPQKDFLISYFYIGILMRNFAGIRIHMLPKYSFVVPHFDLFRYFMLKLSWFYSADQCSDAKRRLVSK